MASLLLALLLLAKAGDQGGLWHRNAGSGALSPVAPSLPSPPLADTEQAIVDTVERAQNAVASVSITKDLPVYTYVQGQSPALPGMDPFFRQFFGQQMQRVQNGTQKKEIGGGTAFFIGSDGLLLTNRHVVADIQAQYTVLTNDGKALPATVVARDPSNDIALLKVAGNGFPFLTLAPDDDVHPGQTAIAIGNALGEFRNTVSVGVISGLQRSIQAYSDGDGRTEQLDAILQTDAAINEGNSGGPLLSSRGEVIGMNTAVANNGQNIGFALPVGQLRRVVDSYQKYGRIVRAYLGVRYVVVTPEMKEKNHLSVDDGILIARGETADDLAVAPGSPADKAGLRENDIVVSADGVKIGRTQSLSSLVAAHQPGDVLSLTVIRKGERIAVSVTLGELPQ